MTMLQLFVSEWKQLRRDAREKRPASEATRLRHKLWRKEIGLAVVALGAIAMLVHAVRGLSGLTG
jgi:hypothetical protein